MLLYENPIRRLRKERGWTRAAAASALQLDHQMLSFAESGAAHKLSRRLLTALAEFGYDCGQLQDEYLLWRHAYGEELLEASGLRSEGNGD